MRKLDGSIYEMVDEANGGVIISRGNVVNQKRIDELAKIEEDRRNSATAFANPAPAPIGTDQDMRNTAPTKVEALEKKVGAMEDNIATILNLLQKK